MDPFLRTLAIYGRLRHRFPTFAIAIEACERGGAPVGRPSTTMYLLHWTFGATATRRPVRGPSHLATHASFDRAVREAWTEIRRWAP